MKHLALLLHVCAYLSNDLGQLLYVILHEIGLRFVILLHLVQLVPILVPNLINLRIY